MQETRRNDELLSGAGDLLGSILGSRRSAGGIARKVGSVARRRGRANEAVKRVETATNRVEEKVQALADLEADLADELAAIADDWDAKRRRPSDRSRSRSSGPHIRVTELHLVWIPAA